jgi:hypothetical protein
MQKAPCEPAGPLEILHVYELALRQRRSPVPEAGLFGFLARATQASHAAIVEGAATDVNAQRRGMRGGDVRMRRFAALCAPYTGPVEPKPPSPRDVLASEVVSVSRAVVTGAITSWAMRAPRSTRNGSPP